MEKIGVKNLKEVLVFAADLLVAGRKASEDGKLGMEDAPLFLLSLNGAVAAFGGITEVVSEVRDLDNEERRELEEVLRSKFEATGEEDLAELVTAVMKIADGLVSGIAAGRRLFAEDKDADAGAEGTPPDGGGDAN